MSRLPMMIAGCTALGAALALAGPAAGRRYQPPTASFPDSALSGVPTSIYDGDTFRFGRLRVRIFGVDAPEMQTRYGAPARAAFVAIVADRPLRCHDTGQRSYDRIVAQCWNWRGQDVSALMARGGWAVDWPTFSHGRYAAFQSAAQQQRRGVFAYGVAPWR